MVLLGEGDQELGTMTSEQLSAEADGAPKGAMRVKYVPVQGEPLVMMTYGVELEDGHRVQMELWRESAAGLKLGVQSEYLQGGCRAPVVPEDGPGCLAPLLQTEGTGAPLPVGSCGLRYEGLVRQGVNPTLESVRWHVPQTPALMQLSPFGSWRGGQDGGDAVHVVYDQEDFQGDTEARQAWLEAAGVSGLVTSPEAQQLYAAWVDDTWALELGRLVDVCGLNPEPSSGQALRTVSQSVCLIRAKAGLSLLTVQAGCSPTAANQEDWLQKPAAKKPGQGSSLKVCVGGCAKGDPHMTSFDRHGFDFQGVGEYVAAKTLSGDPWEVQIRLLSYDNPPAGKPVCKDVSWATALAASLGTHRIGFYLEGDTLLVHWDGQPLDVEGLKLPEGAVLERLAKNSWFLRWPEGHELKVRRAGNTLSVALTPAPSALGRVAGLMGLFDGDPSNDFTTRAGKLLPHPLSFRDLYKEFGDSWRVSDPVSSLFEYEGNQGPATFAKRTRPGQALDRSGLDQEFEALIAGCREEGIRDPVWLEACAIDAYCVSPSLGAEMKHMASPKSTGSGLLTLHGDARQISPPTALGPLPLEAESELSCGPRAGEFVEVFQENNALPLASPLAIDLAQAGGSYDPEAPVPDALDGVRVDTYIVRLDTAQRARVRSYEGGASFGRRVLGVMLLPATLAQASVTRPDTSYPGDWEALKLEDHQDRVGISADGLGIDFLFNADGSPDLFRVIVEAP